VTEALEFYVLDNVSHAEAQVLFKRKMEYHVTNTFLQTFILVMVGYMSYYFEVTPQRYIYILSFRIRIHLVFFKG